MKNRNLFNTIRHVAILIAAIGLIGVAQNASAQKPGARDTQGIVKPKGNGSGTVIFAPSYDSATDFTGDGLNDVVFFNTISATWTITDHLGKVTEFAFGAVNDQPVAADYDGDNIIDIASVHSQDGTLTWQIRQSSDESTVNAVWGIEGDIPMVGDFDGDNKADTAVLRPSDGLWYINGSSAGSITYECGLPDDLGVPGDYDGDGITDVAVFRVAERSFYYLGSADQMMHEQEWQVLSRNINETFVPADYDGDGRTDFAIFVAPTGVWTILESSTGNYRVEVFEVTPPIYNTEVPPIIHEGGYAIAADYDNDGVADPAVWTPATTTVKVISSASGQMDVANDAKSPMSPVSAYFMTQ